MEKLTQEIHRLKEELDRKKEEIRDLRIWVGKEIDREFSPPAEEFSDKKLEALIRECLSDVSGQEEAKLDLQAITSHRKIVGKPVSYIKRAFLETTFAGLNGFLDRQIQFNRRIAAFSQALLLRLNHNQERIERIEEKIGKGEENPAVETAGAAPPLIPGADRDALPDLINFKLHPLTTAPELAKTVMEISSHGGIQAAYNFLLRAEVRLRLRKPSLAVYDHAFHFIGGAQKYGLTLVSALQDRFDVTILANREIHYRDFLEWYNLDLSKCSIKVISLPFFEDRKAFHLDPAFVSAEVENPFHLISRESGRYDVFVNNSMNEMVYPLAAESVFICHFPERRPQSYFYADQYTSVVYNSRYTAEWIRRKWKFTPHQLIYPPVDMESGENEIRKKKIILSVARFEPEGHKRQWEMIEAFMKLGREWPDIVGDWTFILAGGSPPENRYLSKLGELLANHPGRNIELKINLPLAELKILYRESTLFWHMCGLNHDDPGEIEHFGMTTVEAMQNRMVPLVYDGGGLREIIDHGRNGFRVKSITELLGYTLKLIRNTPLVEKLGRAAHEKAQMFTRAKFEATVRDFFDHILDRMTSSD
jgi:glycosyltransferase involved in cell wall biosynthesis